MKTLETTVYVADDGKVFSRQDECEKYEKEIERKEKLTTYWRVTHKPDLTEGRGNYGLTMIEVYGDLSYCENVYINDYCYRTFGRPIAFVQGCSPTENWNVLKIDKNLFNSMTNTRVGDYKYDAQRVKLFVGKGELGLVEGV